ncbi:hypothetical protein D3C73_1334400 [compost metagenome]
MIVYGNGERFLRLFLADYVLIKNIADFLRFRNILQIQLFFMTELFLHDFCAQLDAFVTYINARTRYKLANLLL